LHLNQILLFWVLYARLWPQEQDYFFLAADYKPLKFRSIKCTLQCPAFSLNTSLWFSLIRSPIIFSNLRCYYAVSVFLPNFLHVSSLSQLSSSAKTQENPYHSKRNEFISTLKRFLPSPDSFFFLLQSLRLKLWYSQKFVQKMLKKTKLLRHFIEHKFHFMDLMETFSSSFCIVHNLWPNYIFTEL